MSAPGPSPLGAPLGAGGKTSREDNPARLRAVLIQEIRKAHRFRVDSAKDLWWWNGTCWELAEMEGWTWSQCSKAIGSWEMQGHLTSQFVAAVHANLKVDQPLLQIEPPSGQINLLNGIWDVPSGKLLPHRPGLWPSPIQIPQTWDPAAKAPAWQRYISQVLPEDCLGYFWELLGTLLVGDYWDQKVIWLAGEGGNGKGTLLHALTALIGKRNVASISFEDLAVDRFAAAGLYGKLLCMDPDSSLDEIRKPNLLKKLTGHDEIRAQEKYKRQFDFRSIAKTIVAANGLPTSSDISKGFISRPLIIPMTASFRGTSGERRQQEILAELAAEGAGALNLALAGLARVWARKSLAVPASIEGATRDYSQSANPLNDFAQEHLEALPDAETTEMEIREAYNGWAQRYGLKTARREMLIGWITRHFGLDKPVRKGTDGPRPLTFTGIRLR